MIRPLHNPKERLNHGNMTKRKKALFLRKLLSAPSYSIGRVIDGIRYHSAGRIYTPKPFYLQFFITHKCNSRCIMCDIWKENNYPDLNTREIQKILSNPLFDSITTLAISGGEAILRKDLVDIIEMSFSVLPKLKNFGIGTNGLDTDLIVKKVTQIRSLPSYKNLKNFNVMISVDGVGKTHDFIRGIPGTFEKVQKTISALKKMQDDPIFTLNLNCVVQKSNASELHEIQRFAKKHDLPLTFSPVVIPEKGKVTREPLLHNFNSKHLLKTDENNEMLHDFFQYSPINDIGMRNSAFWKDYFRVLDGKKRKIPCVLLYHSISIDADGHAFICGRDSSLSYGNIKDTDINAIWYAKTYKNLRKNARKNICSSCTRSCSIYFSLEFELFYLMKYMIKETGKRLLKTRH